MEGIQRFQERAFGSLFMHWVERTGRITEGLQSWWPCPCKWRTQRRVSQEEMLKEGIRIQFNVKVFKDTVKKVVESFPQNKLKRMANFTMWHSSIQQRDRMLSLNYAVRVIRCNWRRVWRKTRPIRKQGPALGTPPFYCFTAMTSGWREPDRYKC